MNSYKLSYYLIVTDIIDEASESLNRMGLCNT